MVEFVEDPPRLEEIKDDGPSMILPNKLFLGSAKHARQAAADNKLQITHVLNVCDFLVLRPGVTERLTCEWVPINDDGGDDVFGAVQSESEYEIALAVDADSRPRGAWWRCREFLEAAFATKRSRILVHCAMGVNRSATIVIAWLMETRRWSAKKALDFVSERRSFVYPAENHRKQLTAHQFRLQIADESEKSSNCCSS